jgi:hypothetical protein
MRIGHGAGICRAIYADTTLAQEHLPLFRGHAGKSNLLTGSLLEGKVVTLPRR